MAGFSSQHQQDILQHFPFAVGSLPVWYLGLPLLTRSMTHADYLPLLERIRLRISSWTGRFLSFAGRLQLIKSLLSSLTNFWLSVFRLPKRCLQEIDSLFSTFLWSGPDLNSKKAKISWLDVCKPKHEGGLGLLRLQDTNTVCILKLIWRLVSASNSLWVNWWNTAANGACVLCQGYGETREHLFFSCSYSSSVWSALVQRLLGVRFTISWATLGPMLVDSSTPRLQLFVMRYVFQSIIHSIWRERNARRHGEAPTPSSSLCRFIDKNIRNRLLTLKTTSGYEDGLPLWFQTHPLSTTSRS
ncbi:PREDICTED: uncharacterized protein LOC104743679 [Camelina sativa]|uniref:Uncharacterized protein LOC104743679 n=1 Tax=Camelina sativa TaxID=90675 RepID=A0ABM0VYE8_CAMSA|nr:PREDICTED: uncharacterized protein LOC104743679 [Camelina sativa]